MTDFYISKYIISQPLNENEILLYSTLSTSIITINNDTYESIFKKNEFENYISECKQLEEMGFLYAGDERKQLIELEGVRKEIVNADHGITAITIAPTMECNARCFYCFENGAKKGTMSYETAEQTAKFLISNCKEKKLYISWFGGEPLMAVDIIDYINNKLVENNIFVESTITTNGILIDEKLIQKFSEWNVTRIQITLDGIEEKYNKTKNYILDIVNPFERIMSNIELLISNKFNVHLRVNYNSYDFNTINGTINYLHQRFGYYENLYLYGAPVDLPQVKGYSEFDENEGDIFLKVLKMSLDNGYENDELNFRDLRVSEDYNTALGELMLAPFPANCFMVNKDRYVIDDAGLLYKCQKHLGKEQFNCGSVFDGPIHNDIYNHYVTEKLKDSKCEECCMLPICQGGCNANRLLYGHKFACPPSKSIAPKLVLEYYNKLITGGENDEDNF